MVWRLCAKASPSSKSVLLMTAPVSTLYELDDDDAAAANWRGLQGQVGRRRGGTGDVSSLL